MLWVYPSDMGIARRKTNGHASPWLLFMFQLPARGASQRVRIWRKLQKSGALTWRNSAYILPRSPANLEKLQWLASEIRKYRGDASVVQITRTEGYLDKQAIALFNEARARDYENFMREIRNALRPIAGRGHAGPPGALGRLTRRLTMITALDVFGCSKRKEAETLLKELESNSHSKPTPSSRNGINKAEEYRGRLWMTRPRPEVDRVASGWLIKHFIDPKARFVFSSDSHARTGAVRFDMFEGEFTHVGEDCTFETLIKRFGLRDKRLRLIAQMVHDADLEDGKFGRAGGRALDLILKGWGKTNWPDEEILKKGFTLFDGLYLSLGG